MNMKKTIAAAAAGAMALSATAASMNVNADYTIPETLTQKFPLAKHYKLKYNDGEYSATLQAYETINVSAGSTDAIAISLDGVATDKTVTVTFIDRTSGSAIAPIVINKIDGFISGASISIVGDELFINEAYLADLEVDRTVSLTVTGTVKTDDVTDSFNIEATNDGGATAKQISNEVKVTEKTGDVYVPFKSSVNGSADIISWIGSSSPVAGLGAAESDSTVPYVQRYINDAIANYNDVTITFNTATDTVMFGSDVHFWDASNDPVDGEDFNNNWWAYLGRFATDSLNTPFYRTGALLSWAKPSTSDFGTDLYKTPFGQHIFSDSYGYAPELGSFGNGFILGGLNYNANLFNAALVVNGYYTMQLSDVAQFTYTATGISFNWQEIREGMAGNINTYYDIIHQMNLATSVDWYWDSMDLTFANVEVESGDSDAGATEGDDVIAPDDELEALEPDADEDEVVVAPPAVETPAAPEVAPNPTTGNASVALAVIPVALAAAAIVAKKRK
ncbi:MAG: hypothetical protein LBM87_02270 [Ruminococcus sp.]|nr:hypothetical protein [Ruminococcus sp.]